METIKLMEKDEYSIEEVDAVFGPATGRPKSAVFRTADIVGLDVLMHVAKNCHDNLKKDECHNVFAIPSFMQKMIDNKWLGQKVKQGFYKKENNTIKSLDWKTLVYKDKQKVRFDSLGAIRNIEETKDKIKTLVNSNDKAGLFSLEGNSGHMYLFS